jgi:hypothetical protein
VPKSEQPIQTKDEVKEGSTEADSLAQDSSGPVAESTEKKSEEPSKEDVSSYTPAGTPSDTTTATTTSTPIKSTSGSTDAPGNLWPHPEDMPAPLFSPHKPPLVEEPPKPSGADDDSVELPDYSAAGIGEDDSGVPDSSTFITHDAVQPAPEEPARQQESSQPVDTVVGDLLKAQFVAYEVVPTILVSLGMGNVWHVLY